MILPDKVYNIIKWVLMIFVPALIGLITTLSVQFGWDTEALIIVISAVAAFVGAITGISNINYNNKEK